MNQESFKEWNQGNASMFKWIDDHCKATTPVVTIEQFEYRGATYYRVTKKWGSVHAVSRSFKTVADANQYAMEV